MKYKKYLLLPIIVSLLSGCDFFGKEKEDPNFYHLTFSSNITLTEEQKNEIKETYGYGEQGVEVKERIRPEEDIESLKDAGVTDEDIQKAGVRQDDGSYYFFSQELVYLEAPQIEGYKLDVFFDKATGKLADRAKILGEPNGRKRSRWNMPDKDIELEAHYVELADTISFNFPATDETNPNTLKSCKYSDGEVRLLDTTTTNKFKTFKCWEYQNITYEEKDAPWYEIVDGILPNDYQEDYMRIQAVFETEQLQISFNFETEKGQSLDFDDFINTLKIYSNFAIVDGIKGPIGTKHDGAIITKDSIVLVDSVYGWADLFFTLKTGYSFSYVKLNGVKNKQIDASFIDPLYITIKENYLPSDSVITFVVSTN